MMGAPSRNRARGGQDHPFPEICTTFYRPAKGAAKCQLARSQVSSSGRSQTLNWLDEDLGIRQARIDAVPRNRVRNGLWAKFAFTH